MAYKHKDSVFFLLVCLAVVSVVVSVILTAVILLNGSPSELLLRCVFAGYVLMQKPPPMPPPSEIFRQHILDPIPESVTNIKADRPKVIGGYRYTLRFNINRTDVAKLIDSGSLVRVWNVEYRDGDLFWAWDTWRGLSTNGVTIIVYDSRRWRREPKWFRPELWDNPEAYAFDKKVGDRMNIKVLLYNEKEGEAYFIVSSLK